MINNNKWKNKIKIGSPLLVLLLSSCTSLHPIDLNAPLMDELKTDDKVFYTTKDNQKDKLVVSEITAMRLKGVNNSIELNRIKELKKSQLSPWKNALITGALAGAAVNPFFGIEVFVGSYIVVMFVNNPPRMDGGVEEWH